MQSFVEDGNWLLLREQNRRKAPEVLQEIVADQVSEALNVELQLQALHLHQTKQLVEYLLRYQEEYGDTFARDPETKKLILDRDGQPIPIRLPTSPSEILQRKGQHELIQGLQKLVKERFEALPRAPKDVGDAASAKEAALKLLNAGKKPKD